ncbi:MAG: T9SS type A sorting domain-containing protein [Bacteroidia bacterium]|nr:T9SS type A sorting domain-containing protein [Bacteroidia bacterium]
MRLIVAITLIFVSFKIHTQTLNYYFGNLHAHTAFSDGNKDSVSSGVGRPDGSYAYAKLSDDFDFLGISEHNHYSSLRNPGFKLSRYQAGLTMANNANQDGTFLALFGTEYGVSSNNNGHVIIYGFNQLLGWESNVGGTSGNNYDIYNAKTDYDGLFKKIKNNSAAFCYLAHPYWTDFTTDGTSATALAFAPYNATYDSAIVGLPLRSGNAFSTFTNYTDYAAGNYFDYFKKLLYVGYHLGIGYDHDNHYTNFGRGTGGRLVIVAPTLTRANLYTAMQQMNFYGSDDSNAKVDFNLNGSIMGSILTGTVYPTLNVTHNDPDGELADTIKIWRGYSNSGGNWADIVYTGLSNNTISFNDLSINPNIEYYYFADIKQADGQWIVTSPIWYKGTAPVFVKENKAALKINCFPNPSSKNLSVSTGEWNQYAIEIKDIAGRKVYAENFTGKELSIDLRDIKAGVYLITISSNKGSFSQKLFVED